MLLCPECGLNQDTMAGDRHRIDCSRRERPNDKSVRPSNTGKLPSDSKTRKTLPVTAGVLDYFPLAIAYVAKISYHGNQKHNPGQPLHWAREKSNDHADCIGRHLLERSGRDPESGLYHAGMLAWRALANLQLFLEERLAAGEDIWSEK